MSILGNAVLRREDPRFLTVGGTYVDDLDLPGCVDRHLRTLPGRPRPPARHRHRRRGRRRRACSPWSPPPTSHLPDFPHAMPVFPEAMRRPFLARGTVRFVGRAGRRRRGRDRRRRAPTRPSLVEVDYDPLPPWSTPRRRSRERAAAVPRGRARTSCCRAGTDGAGRLRRLRGRGAPSASSTSASPAAPSRAAAGAASGRRRPPRPLLVVPGRPPRPRRAGRRLRPRRGQVRVVVPDVGGGFGAKARPYPEELLLGVLARPGGPAGALGRDPHREHGGLGHGRGQVQHVTHRRHPGRPDPRLPARRRPGRRRLPGHRRGAARHDPAHADRRLRPATTSASARVVGGHQHHARWPPTAARAGPRRPPPSSGRSTCSPAEIGMDPAEVRRRNLVPPFADAYTTARRHRATTAATTPARSTGRSRPPATTSCGPSRPAAGRPGDRRLLGIGLVVYVEITAGAGGRVRLGRAARRRRRCGS